MAPRSKQADMRAAKEKKQKKIAIAGAVLLVAVLGIQVPRTMKMLGGPEAQAVTPPAETAPTTTGPVSLEPPALTGEDGTAAPGGDAGSGEVEAGAPGEAVEKLVTFGSFASKDPFVQQVARDQGDEQADGEDGEGAAAGGEGGAASEGGEDEASGSSGSGSDADAPTATIAVNGSAELVAEGAAFPASAPAFTLRTVGKAEATIGVAQGGSFADGDATITLKLGEPVTLVNTADGSRYVVLLKSVP